MKRLASFVLAFSVIASAAMAETLELTSGSLRLTLNSKTGSFLLHQLSQTGKNRYEPLLEDRNQGTTSWFSVSFNGAVFKLARRPGRDVRLEPTETGARFVFTPNDSLQITQSFSFVSESSRGSEAVLVETTIENTSGKTASVALKALFDTMLGEGEGIHFFTNARNRISTETRLVGGRDSDSVIVSARKDLSFMVLLDSAHVTRPDSVIIANWERLDTLKWNPDVVEGRSFNTVYSIQDSALLVTWPAVDVQPNAAYSVRTIIGPYAERDGFTSKNAPARASSDASRPIEPVVDVSKLTEGERQKRIRLLLERIAVVEKNPDAASDEELASLNRQLDVLLAVPGARGE